MKVLHNDQQHKERKGNVSPNESVPTPLKRREGPIATWGHNHSQFDRSAGLSVHYCKHVYAPRSYLPVKGVQRVLTPLLWFEE